MVGGMGLCFLARAVQFRKGVGGGQPQAVSLTWFFADDYNPPLWKLRSITHFRGVC
jgi:hypothetical protein